jgi:TonB-linked SusC/RagA family outer membrane protein
MCKKIKRLRQLFLLPAILIISTGNIFAQKIIISGTVNDTEQQIIPGVTVLEKGTINGTITDANGSYSISVSSDATLVFSFIGMITQEIPVRGRTTINVNMSEDVVHLNEVVAIGYGTRSKQALTGSVVNVNAKDISRMNPGNNIVKSLQGMIPGVVVSGGNTPGAGASIQIRGIGTINNTSPLVMVDGIPSDIGRLNPAEIESITVLKDAASTAIYGARGANGVIIVSTIQGTTNQAPKVNLNSRVTYSNMPPQYDLLNPTEYGEMLWMSYKNSNIAPNHPIFGSGATPVLPKYIYPIVSDNIDLGRYHAYDYQIVESTPQGTDWFSYIFQHALNQDYDLTVSGGGDKIKYAILFGYTDNKGIVKESGFDRFNNRTNISINLTDWLEIGENLSVRYQNNWGRQSDGGESSSISEPLRLPKIAPVYDVMGNWTPVTKIIGFSSGRNEPSEIWRQSDYTRKYLSLEGSVYGNVHFLKYFTAKTNFGIYMGNGWNNSPTEANPWNYSGTTKDVLEVSAGKAVNWSWTNTLNYTQTFGDHSIDALAGFESSYSRSDDFSASREEFFLTTEEYYVLSAGEGTQRNSGTYSESSSASYFGRLHYDYNHKYFFDGVIRHDGSSVFAEKHRWGTFPSFAAGWIISNEEFMKSINWLDLLKIRASWGQSGNNRIGTYNGFSTFQTHLDFSYYPIDGSKLNSGFETRAFGNLNAKWETTTTINLGFDIALINALSIGLDIWEKKTNDMLYPKAIPAVYGYATAPSVNIGDMKNRGFDLSINYKGKTLGNDLSYMVELNISKYKNEIIRLSDFENETRYGTIYRDQYYTYAKKGTSFPEFYGYKVLGIFQTQEEADSYYPNQIDPTYNKPGHFKFADVNGDGVIDSEDRTSIGSPHPDVNLGLNLNLAYKNVDLAASFYASIGNDALNIDRRTMDFNYMEFWRGTRRLYESWGSSYLDDNTNAKMPLAEINDQVTQLPSSYYVEDASYVRLRNLQIGYTFDKNLTKKAGMENLRLYIVGSNLFTLTKYDGLDPAFSSSDMDFGVDGGRWPSVKTYALGINVTF